MDQRDVWSAQDDARMGSHSPDRPLQLRGGRHLRRRGGEAETVGLAVRHVQPRHLFIVFDSGEIE